MMLSQPTTPAHLINRDLKRELKMICPGQHEKVRGIRVVRLEGEQCHLYAINGYIMDLDCVADVLTGYTPMPPLKKHPAKVVEPPMTLVLVSPPIKVRVAKINKPKPAPDDKDDPPPMNKLPLFAALPVSA